MSQSTTCPGTATPKPLWLWSSRPVVDTAELGALFYLAFCRRFDIEHTFRMLKQTLDSTSPQNP